MPNNSVLKQQNNRTSMVQINITPCVDKTKLEHRKNQRDSYMAVGSEIVAAGV